MLKMVDFSHWQKDDMLGEVSDYDIFCHKLTEGTSYIDKTAKERVAKFIENKPCIVYHVLTTDDSATQFEHFKKNFVELPTYFQIGIALDIENSSRYFPYSLDVSRLVTMLDDFASRVKNTFKKRLIVYCGDLYNDSFYRRIRELDLGLWVARYGKTPVHTPDIWQYTSNPYDKDYFYGDMDKLKTFLLPTFTTPTITREAILYHLK